VLEGAFDPRRVKAIVFDVDGTLYRQAPLRRAMLWRLLLACAKSPLRGLRTLRVLGAYRRAQEELRERGEKGDLAEAQLRLACERTGSARDFAAACVARWMEEEPLPLVSRFEQPGIRQFVASCKARGLRLGVLSDYPAEAKLRALGLGDAFDAVVCTRGSEVGVFKPHPRGLQVTREKLGTVAAETLYVGDRPEVDAAAARAAGMPCAIVGQGPRAGARAGWLEIGEFSQLDEVLRG
jgi:putative hydrolase of the HAD superfamily